MKIKVFPVAGRLVRCPETGEILSAQGLEVPKNTYWLRRIADKDVLLQEAKLEKTKIEKEFKE